MARTPWYWATTKKIIVAFATIFDELSIVTDHGDTITVPLVFAQKEKFMDDLQKGLEFDMDATNFDIVFPKMGFEISGLNFAPERHVNPLNRFDDQLEGSDDEVMMYNRIPYDITFDLFIGARKFEDSLKIVEQIFPYFSPELTVTIKDKQDFKLETNIPIVLNSSSLQIDYQGTLDTKRTIVWTLNFTAKAYYYPEVKEARRIKQTIIEFKEEDYERIFDRLVTTVVPMTADRNDPHEVVEEWQRGVSDE